jgi:hypothetical protein
MVNTVRLSGGAKRQSKKIRKTSRRVSKTKVSRSSKKMSKNKNVLKGGKTTRRTSKRKSKKMSRKTKYTTLKKQLGGVITQQDVNNSPALAKYARGITKAESIQCIIELMRKCTELQTRSGCDYNKTLQNLEMVDKVAVSAFKNKDQEQITRLKEFIKPGKDWYIPNEMGLRDNVIRIFSLYETTPTLIGRMCPSDLL